VVARDWVEDPISARPKGGSHALALQGITLSFGGVTALLDVDLAVAVGEIRAIIGPNGAGKSSIVNIISGVYRPDCGKVWIGGQMFATVPADDLARLGVARTFQNLALFKGLTVRENVIVGRAATIRSSFVEQLLGVGRVRAEEEEIRAHASDAIELLHLSAVADQPVATLPYGLQKRVELARALAARPRLILLDEPMAGMAPSDKQDMVRFIRAARDEYGTTVVLIEHDIGVVMDLSDRVAVLDYGRKIADGTPAEVRSDQAVIDAYLGGSSDAGEVAEILGDKAPAAEPEASA
jgi:branched-chain amino acid transport system ATP-binding protein